MPLWDSVWLVTRFTAEANLPAANELDTTNDLYPRLSMAQQAVIREAASIFPNPFYSQAPTQLTPSSDRKTFSFGLNPNNSAYNVTPMGWVQIAPNQNAFSGDTFTGWIEGQDFLNEGDHIRLPSNRSWAGTLWGRWVPTPPDITASVQPILLPIEARCLIVWRTVEEWAEEGNQWPELAAVMAQKQAKHFPRYMLAWRRAYRGGGALIDPSRWWFAASDLGTGSRAG